MNAGDIVEYKGKDYLAIKVNEKSVYICENKNFLNLWNNRPTGLKWTSLCKTEGAIKTGPENLKVKEEGAVKVPDKNKKKRIVSVAGERLLKESFERFKKKKEGKKAKSPFYVFDDMSNEKIYILEANIETKNILFHNLNTDTYHFYNIHTTDFFDFNKDKHKFGKEILWDKVS